MDIQFDMLQHYNNERQITNRSILKKLNMCYLLHKKQFMGQIIIGSVSNFKPKKMGMLNVVISILFFEISNWSTFCLYQKGEGGLFFKRCRQLRSIKMKSKLKIERPSICKPKIAMNSCFRSKEVV